MLEKFIEAQPASVFYPDVRIAVHAALAMCIVGTGSVKRTNTRVKRRKSISARAPSKYIIWLTKDSPSFTQ